MLVSLYRFIAVTVAQSKKKWIIICATDDLIPLYRKIGFRDVGLTYEHTQLNGLKHSVMLANVPDAMEGKTVGPIVWNIVWSDVTSYLEQYGILEPDPLTGIRLAIYRLLRPLARLSYYLAKKSGRKFKSKLSQAQASEPLENQSA